MPKWEDIRVSLPTVLSLVAMLAALYGVYAGMQTKIEVLETKLAAVTDEAKKANDLAVAHERALTELVTTLRVKEIIK